MVRLGEKMLAITPQGETSGLVAISVRTPKVGSKVLSIPTDSGNIAVQPFNAYAGDEGIGVCLPCGSTVFLPGEPPNYLPSSWERGFDMKVSQSAPVSLGWSCDSSCPINRSPEHTCKLGDGIALDIYNAGSCTHETGSRSWKANAWYNKTYTVYHYVCRGPSCSYYHSKYVDGFGVVRYYDCTGKGGSSIIIRWNDGTSFGHAYWEGCRDHKQPLLQYSEDFDQYGNIARYMYGCSGRVTCPLWNRGNGRPSCQIGPSPNISVPCLSKPSACRYQDKLKFNGWLMEGRTKSEDTTCVFAKATEGVRSRSTDSVRCDFMNRSSGQSVGSYNGSGDVRLPISPSNTEGFGKAGSNLEASASISVNSTIDTDYTRVPTPRSNSGTACIFSIGRY